MRSLIIFILLSIFSYPALACCTYEDDTEYTRRYWSSVIVNDYMEEQLEAIGGVQFVFKDKYEVHVRISRCFDWEDIHNEICNILNQDKFDRWYKRYQDWESKRF